MTLFQPLLGLAQFQGICIMHVQTECTGVDLDARSDWLLLNGGKVGGGGFFFFFFFFFFGGGGGGALVSVTYCWLRSGRNVMVVAHGNSLRAMVKMLDNVPEADITELNIPTGVPLLYELDQELTPISHRYLGDPAAIAAAAEAVRRQTEKK